MIAMMIASNQVECASIKEVNVRTDSKHEARVNRLLYVIIRAYLRDQLDELERSIDQYDDGMFLLSSSHCIGF